MAMRELELIRNVLDGQLVDCEETEMGRADGVVLEIRDGAPPRVDHLELGFVVLADRIHPRVGKWVERIHKRWSVRRSARYSIKWEKVSEVREHHIVIDVNAEDTPAYDWEKWLRKNITAHLPGGEEEDK